MSNEQGQQRADWRTILYGSFIAQLLSVMGFTASLPFIPLFLVKDLHIASTEAGLWAGIMATSQFLTMASFAPVWGLLGDRFGRKPMVLRAMIGGCILIALMAFTTDVWMLLILRIFQGCLTGTVPANVALVSSVTPKERLGYALGLMQTAVFSGASIGPLLGGTLADLTDYRFTFLITSVALGLAALIVFFFVNENYKAPQSDPTQDRVSWLAQVKRFLFQKEFLAMVIILGMVQFGSSVISPVLALFIRTLTDSATGVSTIAGLELGITGVASALSATVAGRLSDRFGHRRVLVTSAIAAALLYFPQALVGNVWQLVVLRGLTGLFFGGIIPSANALIAQYIPEGRKGAAFGLVSSMSSLGMALGPLSGASIAAIFGIRWVFCLTGIVLLLTAAWVNFVLSAQSKRQLPITDVVRD